MSTYQVVEKFVSINGEGRRAGELAAFIRFKGCNLQCSYCDTSWANEPGCESERLTEEEILSWIRETGVKNVTLTGGEPLLRKGMEELIEAILEDPFRRVEIETNGSVDLKPYHILKKRPSFTMDYKAPDSGMEKEMLLSNLELLGSEDTLKFVVSSRRDMEKALEILEKYRLVGKTAVYFSPVFGRIQPVEIVDFLMEKKLNDVKLQIQLQRIGLNIGEIQFQLIIRCRVVFTINLGVAGKSGFHLQAVIKFRYSLAVKGCDLRSFRSWANQRHVPFENINNLRQFIKMDPADHTAYRRDPVVLFLCQLCAFYL